MKYFDNPAPAESAGYDCYESSASRPPAVATRTIFITGGTGYLGSALIRELIARGHRVHALVRRESLPRAMKILPVECVLAVGDALDAGSYGHMVQHCDTFVQMVGVAHPSPGKTAAFKAIDLQSVRAGIAAAVSVGVRHFVYLSVAQPASTAAPLMRDYVESRRQAEAQVCAAVADGKMSVTFLRPWYVLGPGHRWPILLLPLYLLAALLPGLRESARTMGLVSRRQMVAALVHSIEHPAHSVSVIDVPGIRKIGGMAALATG